jgi:zinc protease
MKFTKIALLGFAVSILTILLSLSSLAQQQLNLSDTLKFDSKILYGKFDNGLTYYIRENKKPEQRAELRLIVKAGSVLEDDDQQGLAHLVEHMAFNGTKSFPKNELVNFLEKEGIKLGADVNAWTSFDETGYMLQIATDTPQFVAKAFKILQEWASAVTFDSTEIDKERGVVGEEWRLRLGAGERIQRKHASILYYKSRYAERETIGKKEIIDTASYETLRRFYRDWYRPELMAVIAVGDFDKTQIYNLIKEDFASLTNRRPARERVDYKLPDHVESLVSIATDKELPGSSVRVFFKRDEDKEKMVGDYRRTMVHALYDQMLNARLGERLQKPNPPFVNAGTRNQRFIGGKQAYVVGVFVKEDSILSGLNAVIAEAYRVKQYGFTQTELDRTKKEMLRGMETVYNERDKSESKGFANELIRNFLIDEPAPGIEMEFAIYKQYMAGITLDEINKLSDICLTTTNRVATVSAPQKESVKIPTEAEVLTVLNSASSKTYQPYIDQVTTKPLIANLPKPGTIVKEKKIESLNVTEWILSNGARVVLKPTDFKNDEILFSAFSDGGTSLVADQDFMSAAYASMAASVGGVGEFDAIALQKMLAGKIVRVSPSIGELSEGFSGSAAPQDVETLFQLTHLYFTAARSDSAAFGALMTRWRASLQNRSASPEAAFQDTLQVTMGQYHFRVRPTTLQTIEEVHYDKALSIYKERFADAGSFTFFFVGNFQIEKIKPFVERYLASLPAENKNEHWKDLNIVAPKGVISKQVVRGIEPKSSVRIVFTGPFEWTQKNRYDLSAMVELANIKLRNVLREEKSGTYGVNVSGSPSLYPRKEYSLTVSFGCNPVRVTEMVNAAFQQIDSLKQVLPTTEDVQKVQEIQRRQHEIHLKENQFWIRELHSAYWHHGNPEHLLDYPKLVNGLKANDIQNAAKKYFDVNNYVKVVLVPEEKQH